jgi:YVTN family beta-propeller protein
LFGITLLETPAMAILSSPCAGKLRGALQALCLALAMLAPGRAPAQEPAQEPAQQPAQQPDTYPGMPPIPDRNNVYSEIGAEHLGAAVESALARVYVPHVTSNDVYVIDPATLKVLYRFPVGLHAQHIVPSYDLKTLWVTSAGSRRTHGSVTPIDPTTGQPGAPIRVDDPYNLYFTPDGGFAIVVAEQRRRLDFRDAHTMELKFSVPAPQCGGLNHADFSIDGRYAIFTCEFSGALVKIDMIGRRVLGYLKLSGGGMPQDIRISPKGDIFYVADMHADGVFTIDAETFTQTGLIHTGTGTHGLYPSRDGTRLYVTNRGSHMVRGRRHGPGSIAVIDFATRMVVAEWPIPDGGSPDMGNVSADGKTLWLSGRFDNEVYAINTTDGSVQKIPVGSEPHGLTVWPQPGRYSLGHTGNMR